MKKKSFAAGVNGNVYIAPVYCDELYKLRVGVSRMRPNIDFPSSRKYSKLLFLSTNLMKAVHILQGIPPMHIVTAFKLYLCLKVRR